MSRPDERLRFVTPLPPLATGIAQYSRDLLQAVDGVWGIDVLAEAGSADPGWRTVRVMPAGGRRGDARPGLPPLYQIGNSGFHRLAFERALREPGVLVLHDVVLHHGRAGELLRAGGGAEYKRLMRRRYGAAGVVAAELVLAGGAPDDIGAFPLSEDYVERSLVTVVHSEHARRRVAAFAPGARVERVAMGVPLPALVDRQIARAALGLPRDAFVIASITHVNPFKRLPVVIRGVRRLIERFPEALLVIAGNVSPAVNLERQLQLYGLRDRTRLLGYVSDDEARLLARAADVCVNLRYPSAGETSASLLRLLGAGRPVLVTDDEMTPELPADAVLPIPVDRFEDEMVAEALGLLAQDTRLRETAGTAARAFVAREHSMANAVAGYRGVIASALNVVLPEVPELRVDEAVPSLTGADPPAAVASPVEELVAEALYGIGVHRHDGTIRSAARALIDLRLGLVESSGARRESRLRSDLRGRERMSDTLPIRRELLEILVCPVCKTPVRLEQQVLVCDSCERRYPIEDGIPIMLVEDDE